MTSSSISRPQKIGSQRDGLHSSRQRSLLAFAFHAAIVEVVSKTDDRTFVSQEFFVPLHLAGTGFNHTAGAKLVSATREPLPPRLERPSWGEAGVYSTASDLLAWYRALRSGEVLGAENPALLFRPVAPIHEGQTGLGWYLGRTSRGTATIFIRGNEDFGANSLLYAYPAKDRIIVILTHAGDINADQSWSRYVLSQLEAALLL